MISAVNKVIRGFKGEGHETVSFGWLTDTKGIPRLHLKELSLNVILFGAFEAEEELSVTAPAT